MFIMKQTLQSLQQIPPPSFALRKRLANQKFALLVTFPEPLLLHKTTIWWCSWLFCLERVNNRGNQNQLPGLLYVYAEHLSCCDQAFRFQQDFFATVPLKTFICKWALLLCVIFFTCEMSNMYHISDRDYRQLPIVEQTVKLTCNTFGWYTHW